MHIWTNNILGIYKQAFGVESGYHIWRETFCEFLISLIYIRDIMLTSIGFSEDEMRKIFVKAYVVLRCWMHLSILSYIQDLIKEPTLNAHENVTKAKKI